MSTRSSVLQNSNVAHSSVVTHTASVHSGKGGVAFVSRGLHGRFARSRFERRIAGPFYSACFYQGPRCR